MTPMALPSHRLREADLYAYGVRLGAHLLAERRFKRGLRYSMMPVPYWRSLEYRLVWNEAAFRPGDRVLDIGSPKLLAIYLAERVGAEVFATDLDSYFLDEFTFLRGARRIAPERLHLETQDGRRLRFPDASFTHVYAISVIEHIPDGGDGECLKEIARVLRPGGKCLITVPFHPTYEEQFRAPDFYWAAGTTSAPDGRAFFQRRYGEADLYRRLVDPSGLHLSKIEYVGERVLTNSRRELNDLYPFPIPPAGPLHPLLSRLVHTKPAPSWKALKKPLCAFVVLTKPAEPSRGPLGERLN